MKSMTGYGFGESITEEVHLSVELKSYNNRYLEFNYNLPYILASYEAEIGKAVETVAKRGHIDVTIRLKVLESEMEVHVDSGAVAAYKRAFDQIAATSGSDFTPALSDYLSQDGVLITTRRDDAERYRTALFETLATAIKQLDSAKSREGESTKEDLIRLGRQIQEGVAVLEEHADELESLVKTQLETRFEELLGDNRWDENRILQEIGVLLVKYSIHEEIKRLAVHLTEYFTLIEESEPVGKRIDFLCQEMNREINTIGSKSQIVALNMQVVAMKDCLENIREQVRNVE